MKHKFLLLLILLFSQVLIAQSPNDFNIQEIASYEDGAADKLIASKENMFVMKTWKQKTMGRTYNLGIEKYDSNIQKELDKVVRKYGEKYRYQQEWTNGKEIYLFFSAKDKKNKINTIHLLTLDAQTLKVTARMKKIGKFNYIKKEAEFHGFTTSLNPTRTGVAVTFIEHHLKKKKLSGIAISMSEKGEVLLAENFETSFEGKPIFVAVNHCYANSEDEIFVALKVFFRGTLRNTSSKIRNCLVTLQKEEEPIFKDINIGTKKIEEFRVLDFYKEKKQILLIGNPTDKESITEYVATYFANPFDNSEIELIDKVESNILKTLRKKELEVGQGVYVAPTEALENDNGYLIAGIQQRPIFEVEMNRGWIFLLKNQFDVYFYQIDKSGKFVNQMSIEKGGGTTHTILKNDFSYSIFTEKDDLKIVTIDKELNVLKKQTLINQCGGCRIEDSQYDVANDGIYLLMKKKKGKKVLYHLSKNNQ